MVEGHERDLLVLGRRNHAPVRLADSAHAVGVSLERLAFLRRVEARYRIEADALRTAGKGGIHVSHQTRQVAVRFTLSEFGTQSAVEFGFGILVAIVLAHGVIDVAGFHRVEIGIDHREDKVQVPVVEVLRHHEGGEFHRAEGRCGHRLAVAVGGFSSQVGHLGDELLAETAPLFVARRVCLVARVITVFFLEACERCRVVTEVPLRPYLSILGNLIVVAQADRQHAIHDAAVIEADA